MKTLRHYYWYFISRLRNLTNPILGGLRRKGLKTTDITIISNNCWSGHFYRWFQLPYDSPTVGLYIFPDDYIRLVTDIEHYMSMDLKFISVDQSKYKDTILRRNEQNVPIGLLGDVEIIFLHYHSQKEAYDKWNRRKNRIHWDNLYFKFSQMNDCNEEHLQAFDKLPTKKKLMFTVNDRPDLQSSVHMKGFEKQGQILVDTMNFKPNINLVKFINNGCL